MKKGESAVTYAIIAILFLAVAAIVFISPLFEKTRGVNEEQEKCALDIKTSAKISHLSKGERATAIDCPTKQITLQGDDQEDIKHRIAQDMVDCHELWGSGELVLFDKDGIYCHKCSILEFEEINQKSIYDFENFLITEPPVKTYAEQLGIPEELIELLTGIASEQVIEPQKKYATIFVYARGEEEVQTLLENLGIQEGTSVGTVLLTTATSVIKCAVKGNGACAGEIIIGTSIALKDIVGEAIFGEIPLYASATVIREHTAKSVAELGCQISFAST